jgi:hypothetical protein
MLLGTPISKCFDQQSPLETERHPDMVFEITPETIETTIEDAIAMEADDSNAASILNSHRATDRIVETVTDHKPPSVVDSR